MTDEPRMAPGAIERSVENLVTVLGCMLPGLRRREIHAMPSDALVAFAAFILAAVVGYAAVDAYAEFSIDLLRANAGSAALAVACAVAVLLLMRSAQPAALAVGLLWALTLGVGLSAALSLVFAVTSTTDWLVFSVLPKYVPALMFLLSQLGPVRGVVVALAAALPSLGVAYEWYAVLYGDASEKVAYEPPDTEMIYAVQRDLLMAESRVPAGDPERTELFAVLGAGYAFEGVFAREVQAVSELLETEFGAEGRVVRLINDDGDPSAYPLLNRVNLRLALDRVGRRMNDDDILFLFLTSHGGQGVLSTTFYPVITRDIGPQDIDEALQAAGIRNAVIVISACYSGSFTDALARPERLVLTAARGDRTSFGCSDKSDWTEWGRAFFVEALPLERDPRTAAVRAREIVAKREDAQGLDASEPQIQEGDAIGPVIERWLAELEADRD